MARANGLLAAPAEKQRSIRAGTPSRARRSGERDRIATSTRLAARTVPVYVAQVEHGRTSGALAATKYLGVTRATLRRSGGLWFNDELVVIALCA